MTNNIRLILPAICISIALLVLGCSSTEEQGLTLKNVQDIGFETEENITKQYWKFQDLLEAWNGNILVNDESKYLGILIFKGTTIEGYPLTNIPMKSASIQNIALACEDQEICDYVVEQINLNK
tara:strand:- start:428 stop:799 length:372 start_codon:yes stop_codon:yes gene_type:complete